MRRYIDIKPRPRTTYYPDSTPVNAPGRPTSRPREIYRTQNYESYVVKRDPNRLNAITRTFNPNEVKRTYKTFNETQKFNQSGIIKERHNYILFQNRNWTEKKRYPVVEIEKEQPPEPVRTFKKIKKEKAVNANYIRKADTQRKRKKINVELYNYDENKVEDNRANTYIENGSIIEETIVKKIIKTEEYYDEEDTEKKITTKSSKKHKKAKTPIKVY